MSTNKPEMSVLKIWKNIIAIASVSLTIIAVLAVTALGILKLVELFRGN